MKLGKAIEKLQLEVAALDDKKEWPKETNMAGFPTLIWLHHKPQGCAHHNFVIEAGGHLGCSQLGSVRNWGTHKKGSPF